MVHVVLPALVLNYFGQGALILGDKAAIENPFFENAAHTERASDLLRSDGFALVGECSHGRDHEAPEIRDRSVVRSSVIASAKYSCSGLFDKFANGRTTTDKGDDTTLVGARTGKTAPAGRGYIMRATARRRRRPP